MKKMNKRIDTKEVFENLKELLSNMKEKSFRNEPLKGKVSKVHTTCNATKGKV